MDVGEALRGHATDQLNDAVTKYFARAMEATVTFAPEAHRKVRADITVHPGRGLVVQGGAQADDAYAAFDGALNRIAKQLRRYKRRLKDHHKGREDENTLRAQQYVLAVEDDEEESADDAHPAVIAEMQTEIATLTVGEAVMRMDLADLPVLMFRNRAHGGLNVLYRRGDGHIGWIDPSHAAS